MKAKEYSVDEISELTGMSIEEYREAITALLRWIYSCKTTCQDN